MGLIRITRRFLSFKPRVFCLPLVASLDGLLWERRNEVGLGREGRYHIVLLELIIYLSSVS